MATMDVDQSLEELITSGKQKRPARVTKGAVKGARAKVPVSNRLAVKTGFVSKKKAQTKV